MHGTDRQAELIAFVLELLESLLVRIRIPAATIETYETNPCLGQRLHDAPPVGTVKVEIEGQFAMTHVLSPFRDDRGNLGRRDSLPLNDD